MGFQRRPHRRRHHRQPAPPPPGPLRAPHRRPLLLARPHAARAPKLGPDDPARPARAPNGGSRMPRLRDPDAGLLLLRHHPPRRPIRARDRLVPHLPDPLPHQHRGQHAHRQPHRRHPLRRGQDDRPGRPPRRRGRRPAEPVRAQLPARVHPATVHQRPGGRGACGARAAHLRRLPALRRPGCELQRHSTRLGPPGGWGVGPAVLLLRRRDADQYGDGVWGWVEARGPVDRGGGCVGAVSRSFFLFGYLPPFPSSFFGSRGLLSESGEILL